MEGKKNSKLGLGILIGLLIAAVIGLGTYVVFDKIIDNDKNDNENGKTVEKISDTNNTNAKIEYKIEEIPGGKQLYVNGKVSKSMTGFLEINVLGQIGNALVVEAGALSAFDIFLLTENDEIIKFDFGTYLFYRGDAKIEGNAVIITRDTLGQDPIYSVCNKSINDIVQYTQKYEYSNGKISNPTTLKSVTAGQYISDKNINCSNYTINN